MSTVDARIEGEPASIRAVSSWLSGTLAPAATQAADTSRSQLDRAAEAWDGTASEAAQGRIATLSTRTTELGTTVSDTARSLDTLAAALEAEQAEMDRALGVARNGGLQVDGTVVHQPPAAQPVADLPAGATPEQAQAHGRAMQAHALAVAKIRTWDEVVDIVERARSRWRTALDDASRTWTGNSGNLVGLTRDLLAAGAEVGAITAVSRFASSGAQMHAAEAASLARHVSELAPDGRVVTTPSHWYDLYDRMRAETALADDAARAASNAKVPVALGRGLLVLGVAATGYGIYDDIQDGESPAQAAVSNGAGFAASLLAGAGAGAATGAIVGSFVPVPVVGTVAGAVVGTVVGTTVGLITSGAVDSMWENGVDSLGDVGNAIADGWDEMTSTVGDAGEMIGDAAGAVGGTVKDAWDALF
ncbi:hypothetical protein [Cellulomonas sp.]|uniref:hypothetical protein n=1 Tax=Cellulomonas sp. TaxID=40001 RepID=UPI0028112F35|nr:hypothetical protein [Cellulomonas sp.]